VVIEGGAHTIPFDANLSEVAGYAAEFIGKEMKRRTNGDKKCTDEWRKALLKEKQSIARGIMETIERESSRRSKMGPTYPT
jgi:hypothetical protein